MKRTKLHGILPDQFALLAFDKLAGGWCPPARRLPLSTVCLECQSFKDQHVAHQQRAALTEAVLARADDFESRGALPNWHRTVELSCVIARPEDWRPN
jgi:hypothetical protein